jgi:2C-methyl-D-erythritol 2,4-cyclodiphosphate synthase
MQHPLLQTNNIETIEKIFNEIKFKIENLSFFKIYNEKKLKNYLEKIRDKLSFSNEKLVGSRYPDLKIFL